MSTIFSERKEMELKKKLLEYFRQSLLFTGNKEQVEFTVYQLTSDVYDIFTDFTKQ
jgi:hypothetical protein